MHYNEKNYYISAYEKYKNAVNIDNVYNIKVCWSVQKGNVDIWNNELERLAEEMLTVWTTDKNTGSVYEEVKIEWEN